MSEPLSISDLKDLQRKFIFKLPKKIKLNFGLFRVQVMELKSLWVEHALWDMENPRNNYAVLREHH